GRDLRVPQEDGDHLLLRRMGLAAAERGVLEGIAERRRGRRRGVRSRNQRQRERDDQHWSQARKLQSLLPRKFSGVTSTIAIACETIFPQPNQSRKTSSQSWLTPSAATATRKNAIPCKAKWPFWRTNVQWRFHQ